MKLFWAPGRRFSDVHWVALRYPSTTAAVEKMEQPNFPKEAAIKVDYCQECGVFHIVREAESKSNGNVQHSPSS
jgi:hypothetical protein